MVSKKNCVVLAAVIVLIYLYFTTKGVKIGSHGKFSLKELPIANKSAGTKEEQSLFKEFYWNEYKNYDFSKIHDKSGELLNTKRVSYVKNIEPYYDMAVTDFKHANFYNPIGTYGELRALNENVSLQTCPRQYSDENKDPLSFNFANGKADLDRKNILCNNQSCS